MNSKCFWLIIVFLGTFFSCKAPAGLPTPSEMLLDGMGAHIKIENRASQFSRGELIAVDEQGVYVLVDIAEKNEGGVIQKKALQYIARQDILAFTLHYAMGKDLSKRIPFYTLGTLAHGWWLVFTMPLNLIVTSAASNASNNEYSLRDKEISVDDLWQYARFPQGLPDGIVRESITAH